MAARARISLLTACACLLLAVAATPAAAETTYETSFGSAATTPANPYPLTEPGGVGVNETTGDVYVADTAGNRVEQFDSSGGFVRMWGRGVDQSTGGDVCPVNPGDVCQAGASGAAAGWFDEPAGIAVDNSSGPAAGSVYVVDRNNNRIQRFTADGHFVLTWGKAVDQQTAANVCTAASGHTCQAGLTSGAIGKPGEPNTPSEDGAFLFERIFSFAVSPGLVLATDAQGYVYVADQAIPDERIQKFDSAGAYLGRVAPAGGSLGSGLLDRPTSPAVAPDGAVYAVNGVEALGFVAQFDPADFTPASSTGYHLTYGTSKDVSRVVVDPTNGYLLTLAGDCLARPDLPGTHIVEYQPATTQEVDCTIPSSPPLDSSGAMAISGASHQLYVTDPAAGDVDVFQTPVAEPPEVTAQSASEVAARGVRINAEIAGNLEETSFHVEYGTSPCSELPDPCQSTPESASVGAALSPQPGSEQIDGLTPNTTYYYRVVAHNGAGTDIGPDRRFTTFATSAFDPSCPNNLARQQTGAAFLLDCRAYELVSAEDTGGYDVESDLVPGQTPYGGSPEADGKALYAVHDGGILGTGNPTNRGPDPYLATRDEADGRWNTTYVGIPANVPSTEPFSSTLGGADASLAAFAFTGPDICSPCFANGTAGIPLRLPSGKLVQGMVGAPGFSVPTPIPAAAVRKPLSADGSHFVFGSTQQFASGANNDAADATIYDRNLSTGKVQAVSLDHGEAIQNGTDLAELDVSRDGSRILIGEKVGEDSAGDPYWHLFMHVGLSITTIDLTPGATDGVLYDGMSEDGTRVYFTTKDALATGEDQDTDHSADIYRADVGSAAAGLTRVSAVPGESPGGAGDTDSCTPAANSVREHWNTLAAEANCDAVALGGGGGVAAASGDLYFLSPEQLDGTEGEAGAPNLYLARPGHGPLFIATLESSAHQALKPKEHLFQRALGPFSYPEGVAIDHATGATYALDTLATSGPDKEGHLSPGAFVQKFEASGEKDLTFGANSKLDGSASTKGAFLASGKGQEGSPLGVPTEIAVDNSSSTSKGDLYVPDFGHQVVDKFSPTGHFLSQINFVNKFDVPTGLAVNQANGNLYVTGGTQDVVYTFAANGLSVAPISFNVTGPALGIAVDNSGNSYVVNGQDTRLYNSSGAFVKVFDSNPSYGVAVDPSDGHVYVDEGNQVVEYNAAGTVLTAIHLGITAKSVSLAADSGRLAISDPGRGTVLTYSAPRVPASSGYDNPLVIDSVSAPEARHSADFQTNPSGAQAVFPSAMPLTGVDSDGHYEVFRSDAGAGLRCVSCDPTEAPPTTDSSLASDGLSLTDDGRVFFNSGEPLVLRDANDRTDVYEWSAAAGRAELISAGQGQFGSSLLSASADGTDAFFFTREKLADNDRNGNLTRLYDAREGGGFFVIPPPPQCKASDECHGPGAPPGPEGLIGSGNGSGGQYEPPTCKKPKVLRNERCVKPHGRKHHKRRHRRQRGAHHG